MEYVIREHNGKFEPGALIEEKVWAGLFRKRAIVKRFVRYSLHGRLMFYYNYMPTPPALNSFETLEAAVEWLENRLKQKRQEAKEPTFHPFYNHGNQTTEG